MATPPRGSPGYWMYEAGGAVRPAIAAYLMGEPMTEHQTAVMRAYLRQWMTGPWQGQTVHILRSRIKGLTTRAAITAWLADALKEGIDPL